MDDLVRDHVFHRLTGGLQILARVKVVGMLGKVLADVAGHGQTDIGVDIDLADGKLGSLTELILGDSDSVGHIAAVLVDHLNKLLGNGGRTVQHDGESGQTLDALMQHVETQRGRHQDAIGVAGALGGLELVGAVRGADGDGQRVAAGAGDELLHLFGVGVALLAVLHSDLILHAGQSAQLRLDHHAVIVGVLHDLAGQGDIFLKRLGGGVDHDGGKAAVDAVLAQLKGIAVVQMQRNGDLGILDNGGLHQLHQIGMVGIGAGALGNLQDDGASQLAGSLGDALDDLHIVDVEGADCIAAVISLRKHFFRSYKCHFQSPYEFCVKSIFTNLLFYYILNPSQNQEVHFTILKFFYPNNGGYEQMSKKLIGAAVFGQSGGPTAVINASAYGVIRAALDADEITKVYGAANGIKGVLEDRLYIMDEEDPEELKLLLHTPSSALGSCRYKIADPEKDDTDYKRILEIFKKYNIRYFFYNGGNDSMDTCNKISRYMESVGYECRVMGVPKTIDNDLYGTDHCPGFGSAAKYIATSCMEINKDARVYDNGMVTIVEIMGRHAGWLAASAALATEFGSGPDLIYLPEVDFDMDKFLNDVQRVYDANGKVLVAVSEGIHYADGSFVSEAKVSATDGFGHAQLGGLAALLAAIVKGRTGAKVRGIELSLLQRCGAHLASATDIEEARSAGEEAVKQAVNGVTGKMVAFEREDADGNYKCKMVLLPLNKVANYEKKIPLSWLNEEQNGLKHEFIDYVLPLIQGEPKLPLEHSLPRYARLKKVLAK